MIEKKIQEKIDGVAKVELAVPNEVELFNPQKNIRMINECVERNRIGYFDFELLQKDGKQLLKVLRTYKGCVGLIVGRRVIFRDIDIVEKELKKHKVIAHMYATGNQRFLPLIMCRRMSVVTQEILYPFLAATIQISRGLILCRLALKVLEKKSGKEWKMIKQQIANQADRLNVDFNMTLNRQNYSGYLDCLMKQMEDANISYGLKALMVLVDNEPQKLSNLAVAVTKIVMADSVDKLLENDKAKPIGLVTNHVDFVKDFLKGLLDFKDNEQLGNPVVDYSKKFNPWVVNAKITHDKNLLARLNVYYSVKTVAEIDVDELSKTSVVPKLLEAETGGAIANITDIRSIPASGSNKTFKEVISRGKIVNEDSVFGHQEMRSSLSFVFVGENSGDFDAHKAEDIKFELYQLGDNIPWDFQLEEDWGKYRTFEKVLILTFLLMLGVEELASAGSDAKIVNQAETDAFLENCCTKVAMVAGDKITADSAVPEVTLDAAIKVFTGKKDSKLSSEYLERKGFKMLKEKKSAPVYKHYRELGYDEDELLSPRSGGKHVLGINLKSKEEVQAAGYLHRIKNRNARLSDIDFITFFYDQFEKLIRKYGNQFRKTSDSIKALNN